MNGFLVRAAALVALGAVDYELHRPWRLVVIILMGLYLWQWTAFRHRREAIRIARQRRHRLANRLQVVAGWLQLGNIRRAEESLQALMESESSQSVWFRGLPSRWAYLFLRWDGRAEERGIIIHWHNISVLQPSYHLAWMLEWRLSQAMRMAETAMRVEFYGPSFGIRIEDVASGRLPWGWRRLLDGVECWWARWPGTKPSGRSAEM